MVYENASYDYPFPLSDDHVRVHVHDTHAQMMMGYDVAHLNLSQTTVPAPALWDVAEVEKICYPKEARWLLKNAVDRELDVTVEDDQYHDPC